MKNPFDRVIIINLDRRPDKLDATMRRIAREPWIFGEAERVTAIDGDSAGRSGDIPSFWRSGNGAWGCFQTHLRELKRAKADGVERLLILEDDIMLGADFAKRAGRFLAAVPEDWGMLYLGGQHLSPPILVAPDVLRVTNGHRTHAYAVQRHAFDELIEHLEDLPWSAGQHVDHRIGELHPTGRVHAYAPKKFLIGQSAISSDISGATRTTDEMWDTDEVVIQPGMEQAQVFGVTPDVGHPCPCLTRRGDIVVFKAWGDTSAVTAALHLYADAHDVALRQVFPPRNDKTAGEVKLALGRAGLVVVWRGDQPGNKWVADACSVAKTPCIVVRPGDVAKGASLADIESVIEAAK